MHNNIVRGFGYKEGRPYTLIAMEICERSLYDEIQVQDGIGPEAFQVLIKCLTAGLKCLFSHNIIHSDLKPHNILVMNGIYKLADFGLSQIVSSNEKLSMAGGSFHYCHPYVFEAAYWHEIGLPEMPTRLLPREIDIYSTGVLLYQAISNKIPLCMNC